MCYCDMLINYCDYDVVHCVPTVNYIDMGAFVVRAIYKEEDSIVSSWRLDGIYYEAVVKYCKENNYRVLKIDKVLFIHN